MLGIVIAALALVPMPQSVRETGGVSTATNIVCERDAAIAAEGYRLVVKPDVIVISSSDAAGEFYARQTLLQLGTQKPCVEIDDAPAYPWRGVLIDESRHFLGKVTVKRVLDQMSYHKLNVLHWHLTDDQGWRLDAPEFPDLVKYGAKRASSPLLGTRHRRENGETVCVLDDVPYGPYYYSESDVREIVAYAAERHIAIVPEIEVPGHVYAALCAYPEFACFPENLARRSPRCHWGIEKDVLCVGNPDAIRFYEKIFDYVCSVFPSKVVHIGGDECPRVRWKACPKCQRFIEQHNLGGEDGLQAWATMHFADYLARKGRRLIGWEECLSSGEVPKGAIGMTWRMHGKSGAGTKFMTPAEIVARGHDLVATPTEFCYHDYTQGLDGDPYQYIGGRITLEKAYSFDPAAGIPLEGRSHVLGGQSNCWGEYIWNWIDLEWKMWPRAAATAEVLWTGPARREFADFEERMAVHRKRLVAMGVNCAPLR